MLVLAAHPDKIRVYRVGDAMESFFGVMTMWETQRVVLSDNSVVWNVTGHTDGGDDDTGTPIEIGCDGKRHAASLAKSLNRTAYVHDIS